MKAFIGFLLLALPSGIFAQKAMVVSAREEASKIGVDILKQGGNAFDAMIATELVLAVAYPYAGNISGGGFLVYRLANGETGTLDFREKAPLAATKDMFVDDLGNLIPNKSTESAFAIGIPGTIAGIFEVHKKFGSLPIKTLFAPAIKLAETGVVVTEKQKKQLDANQASIIKLNGNKTLYAKNINVGDTIRYLALARTLQRISDNGRDEFYKGETGKKLVKYIRDKGGFFSMADLQQYEAKWRDPIIFNYKELKVISMGPPSSGGICLGQILQMIEPYDLKSLQHNSTKYIQLLAEAERRSYADRSFYLGDPDFVRIPRGLQSKKYTRERMSDFSFATATKSADVSHGSESMVESDETTHYSILDASGNAVAVTTTLNGAFGSKLYCDELGFFLNNQMDDFSARPGVANSYGLVGAKANSIAPGKRMLSSMTPTIVERNGKLWMVVGTPGGSTIITSVLQTILNVYEFEMDIQNAVNAPRFHHQWLPDDINFEPGKFSRNVLEELQQKGYNTNENRMPVIGKVDAILIDSDGNCSGGADIRGDDKAVSY